MNPHYPAVSVRAGHLCEYCRAPESIFNSLFEVEHIVPVSRGGPDDPNNLALACRACNLAKSDYMEGYDEETQALTRLFHPRNDTWRDHFLLDTEAGTILGSTPMGRATVARLQLNSATQVMARRRWIALGLYP